MQNNFNIADIRLVAGIGNPGETHARTYHNVGILFLEYLLAHAAFRDQDTTSLFRLSIRGTLYAATSSVFMNQSGGAISSLVRRCEISLEALLLAHDDSDIALGEYSLAFARGSAGHNGVVSVITALNTNAFWRLRIGVRDHHETRKAEDFVLRPVSASHMKILEGVFEKIVGMYFAGK